jgi:hypothetical protein
MGIQHTERRVTSLAIREAGNPASPNQPQDTLRKCRSWVNAALVLDVLVFLDTDLSLGPVSLGN